MRTDPPAANLNTQTLSALLSALGRRALDAVLPPHCGLCHTEVDAPATLCADCWQRISFVGPTLCACCGTPFDRDWGNDTLCAVCIEIRPTFDWARAAVLYDDAVRALILSLKHGDRHELTDLFSTWVMRAGDDIWRNANVIIPVPLHWTRLWTRRFNQSALIAKAVGRLTNTPVILDAVTRTRRTSSQGGLGRKDRLRNVKRAFRVRANAVDVVREQHIVVIDDVLTTGATVSAVAESLKKSGRRPS